MVNCPPRPLGAWVSYRAVARPTGKQDSEIVAGEGARQTPVPSSRHLSVKNHFRADKSIIYIYAYTKT